MSVLSCEDARRFISDYLDGELDSPAPGPLAEHLESCPACRELLESLSNIKSVCADPRSLPVPDGFSTRLYKKVERLAPREHALAHEAATPEVPVGITDQFVPLGSHLIHFWQNQADFERGVRFLYPGLGKQDHCIIFGHAEALENVQEVLREAGYDPAKLIHDRKLTVLLRHADANTTVAEISAAMECALKEGARAIRFLGNLGIGAVPLPAGEDDVLQLESRADALIRDLPAIIVCMYDIRTLPGKLIFNGGLLTHDLSVCDHSVQRNPFYQSPSDAHHLQ